MAERIISEKKYDKPVMGGSITGNLVEIIGEQVMEIDGKICDQYVYNIVGYTPKNGKPFAALKANIFVLD